MIKIIPAILTNDFGVASSHIKEVENFVERISVDIIDGRFAPNKTIDPSMLVNLSLSAKLDFQLMVFEPINWIDKCVAARADRIIGHIEYMDKQQDFVVKVKENGALPGLALDLNTPFSKVMPEVLSHIDVLLVMSVKAGESAQVFEQSTYQKLTEIIQYRVMNNLRFYIQVDGGVDREIAKKLQAMEVDEVSMTSKIFQGNPSYNLNELNSYLSLT